MAPLGKHVILELYGCNGDLLDDPQFTEGTMRAAIKLAGMHLRQFSLEKFEPIGLTACAVLSESHMTLHTFPELGYCAADVFTCGQEGDPLKASQYLLDVFQPTHHSLLELKRGVELVSSDFDPRYQALMMQEGDVNA